MDSVSKLEKRVHWTRFQSIETEYNKLSFKALKTSSVNSFFKLRNRVLWTRFLCVTHCQLQFHQFPVSPLPSHSISSPQQQHHVGITVPPQQHQSPTLHVSVGPSWTCPSLPWGLIISLYCEYVLHIQKHSLYIHKLHSALTSMKQVL